jgi:hypothetical protein
MSDAIQFTTTIDEAAEDELTQRLIAYNTAHTASQPTPPQQPQPLHLFARDAAGALIGGLIGRTRAIPFWLEISILWVDEAQR